MLDSNEIKARREKIEKFKNRTIEVKSLDRSHGTSIYTLGKTATIKSNIRSRLELDKKREDSLK